MKDRVLIGISIAFFVLVFITGYGLGRVSHGERYDINVPTCTELDNVGYDGLATFLDADGNYQTPGR